MKYQSQAKKLQKNRETKAQDQTDLVLLEYHKKKKVKQIKNVLLKPKKPKGLGWRKTLQKSKLTT